LGPIAYRNLIAFIRSIVSIWRGYIELNSWAIVGYFLILLFTHLLFSIAGLILVLGVALYVLLYFLEKWLDRHQYK
jgi:hypothetical protein